ncbi:ABC-type metal ion transport system, periplasmic component/surface antigen [Weissella oryzae SG25]|uniref:ABC-type metal ion transport system, periplasmic component/surface antigen n=1 Tax=Weissella oryzae (strain DSM 25784 / JCM 18191 / LMG 30913 / SG25) TaxID=1329250 RepID=A0A069CTS4_WEIOS|nr:MetQ/NlpA family ABC transporter substrate-binding protein [Weissella oryzae]GAK31210.1 ABC-type metal ion transport system, periplasmic component/surface antigen [Weissella oryzae SG25]
MKRSNPQAKADHLKIKVKIFSDGALLNKSTANGDIDVNAFQSYGYFTAFNQASPQKLAALGTTYIEPMGLFSQYHSIKAIPDGATIALSSDDANQARGLRLLAAEKLITLKSNFNDLSTIKDIQSNPHNFQFKAIDDTTGVSVLKNDKSVGAVLISNSTAQAGHLNVLKDALAHEKVDASTKININILATASKNQHNKTYQTLLSLYHNPQIQKWITKQYAGTKVEVNKSIAYLKEAK